MGFMYPVHICDPMIDPPHIGEAYFQIPPENKSYSWPTEPVKFAWNKTISSAKLIAFKMKWRMIDLK